MRTIAVFLVLLLVTPPLAAVVLVASLLGVPRTPDGVYQKCAHLWNRATCAAAGVRISVFGGEFETSGAAGPGVVFCTNHVSWFDVLSLAVVVQRYTFVAKRELAQIPIFGRAARAVGLVFIDRKNRKEAFAQYEAAAAQVREGKSIVVCPEGTRGYDYRLRPFKKGPFVLAISAGVPIVPTVVYGAREVQRKGKMTIRGGEVKIHFLPPVATAGYSYEQRDELMQVVWKQMADFLHREYGVESSGGPIGSDPERAAIPSSFF
jgi:1-acyl-sn-glycerol-3-phosphate acyltransferase